MKTPATFTDEKLRVMDRALDVAISASISFGSKAQTNELMSLQKEIWQQLHGTEATDVEGA